MSQQAPSPPIGSAAIPITYPNAPNIQLKLVNQCCGMAVAVFFASFSFLVAMTEISGAINSTSAASIAVKSAAAITAALFLYFFIEMIRVPEFLAGKPDLKKFWAPAANLVMNISINIYLNSLGLVYDLASDIFKELFIFAMCVGIYIQDDASESCCLSFKPWIYKKVQTEVIYVQAPTPFNPNQGPPSYPTVPFTYPGYNAPQQNVQIKTKKYNHTLNKSSVC